MTKEVIKFIICYDEERYLEECIYYINKLQIPLGFGIEIVSVKGVRSLSEEHNAAIQKCKEKYKIFLDQRTFIIRDTFLYDMLLLFRENPQIGMFGVLGKDAQGKMDKGRVLVWNEDGLDEANYQNGTGIERAVSLNGMLIATQYDAEWEETWDGLSCNQMQERGYGIVIPHQDSMWCLYDCGDGRGIAGGKEYRFMVRRAENYRDELSVATVELMLKRRQMPYGEHSAYVEKNALGNGSFAGYFWEDALFIGRNWKKYLEANGKVSVEDRTENEMHVVLSFNHKYAVYAAVMIQSLYDNNPFCNIYVHVLQKDLTEWDKSELEKQAAKSQNAISFYMVDSSILPQDVEATKEWPIEAYFRLFMLEILPQKIDRILYLDVDIIVNQPIYDFYFMNMKEYDIVGCRDFSMVMKKNFQDKREELFSSMKGRENFTYINSGVMLMNLSRLREKICAKDYLAVMEKQKGKLVAPDQDIINLVHWECIGLVDEYRYDFFNACLKGISVEEVKQYVSIIHYAGPKPWQVGDIDMHAHRIWWEYAVKTDMAQKLVYETLCSGKRLISEQRKAINQMKYCRHVPFMSCEVDGIKYIGNSLDLCIMRNMYETGENWSKGEIDIFFDLTKIFYGYGALEAEGIFLDVGGNIGTTSIYVNRVKAHQLRVIAFEPIRENIRIFKANCALNDITEDKVSIVEKAVSNKAISSIMERNIFNPGMSRIVQSDGLNRGNLEEVESISLDDYMKMVGIKQEEIRYLWMDVEGYEGYVIDGAKELLGRIGIPIMMEFVPQYLKRQDCYELLIKNLCKLYSYFICLEELRETGQVRIRDIGTLNVFGEELGEGQINIFLVKDKLSEGRSYTEKRSDKVE